MLAVVLLLVGSPHVWAVDDIPTVITNLRNWVVGILAALATLFLTFGGLRYLMAGGDPGEVEAAKRALRAAAIGYGLAILAPVVVTVLQGIVGVGEGGGGQ
ncbi:pilin [Streptomyces buecherae]|uniref:pilin n=1 Tax=Streptomyces buecherae TaxID=2763006 RepID=UPI0033D64550